MERTSWCAGLVLVLAVTALSQDTGTASSKKGSGSVTDCTLEQYGFAAGHTVTLTGCLTQTGCTKIFKLADGKHPKGVAVQSDGDLSAAVGHKVTLYGAWTYTPKKGGGGISVGADGELRMTNMYQAGFAAMRVVNIGDRCSAGATAKNGSEKPAAPHSD